MVGGIVGVLYSPFYALAYFATEDGAVSLETPWVAAWAGAVRPVLEPFITFAAPEVVYLTYGKLFSLVILGWIAGLLALHARQSTSAGGLEKWGLSHRPCRDRNGRSRQHRRLLGGKRLVESGRYLVLGVPGTGIAPIQRGVPLFGVGTLRAKVAPRLGAWLLTVGGFPGIFLLAFLTGQLTLGLLLLNLGWVFVGYRLWSHRYKPV
jgi:hypothetical protein